MLAQCVEAVTKAAGRALSKAELDGIEERMLSSMQTLYDKDPSAWRTLSKEQRYQEAAKLARSRYADDVAAGQARTIRDMQIRAKQLRMVDSFKPGLKGQLLALSQRVNMLNRYSGDVPLPEQINGVMHDLSRLLDGGVFKGKFFGLIQNPVEQRNFIKAIFGEPTGNPEIDAVGKQVRDVLESARQMANDAGIKINHLENWNLPQPWAWEKIGADFKQFVNDMMAEINPNRYVRRDGTPMTMEEIRKTVEASAETLGTDGASKNAEGGRGVGYGGSVGSSRNAPRQLHFKNADGYIRMMEKYGSANNVLSMLDRHFRGLARDIATARMFGSNADQFVRQLADRAFTNDAKSGLSEKELLQLKDTKTRMLAQYDALRNPGHPGALPLWAQISDVTRGVVGATLLGGSTISAIPDVGMALAYGHEIGLSRKAILSAMAEGANPSKESMAFKRRLGITAQTLQDGTHRFGAGELSNQFTRFLNHGVHVASVLRMWDRSMTHGIAAPLMDMLGEWSRKDHVALDPRDHEYLASRGVTPEHYATWQQAELEKGPNGDHTMLTPDAIYSIPSEKLEPIARARMGDKASAAQVAEDVRRLRSEAAQHLLSLTLAETKIGVRGASGNTIRDSMALGITPDNAGTIKGQMARWFYFLKQTPLGIFRTHMLDVPGGMNDWKSAWAYRARFMAYSASLGALALTLKTMALGQDPEDLLNLKGAGKVAIASGGLGMYGDFLLSDNTEHQNNALEKVIGPGATFAADAFDLFNTTKAEAAGEGSTRPGQYGAKALRFARNYAAPFTRLWYAKAAFNHMVYQQQMEKLSPGYNARVRQRMARQGQTNWWQPGAMTPDRAPNLGGAIGLPANP